MSKKHEIIFETDGRHSSVYLYEPPMGIRQYVEPIDEVLDLGVDTISYVVGTARSCCTTRRSGRSGVTTTTSSTTRCGTRPHSTVR